MLLAAAAPRPQVRTMAIARTTLRGRSDGRLGEQQLPFDSNQGAPQRGGVVFATA